eukprot:9491834-Pyramimonas_sp.AAC.1
MAVDEDYVKNEVRARGGGAEKMMPNDLIIQSVGSVARLEQGPLKGGRIARRGYVYKFREAKGSPHRHLKADLEETRDNEGIGLVHLCAASHCTLPA